MTGVKRPKTEDITETASEKCRWIKRYRTEGTDGLGRFPVELVFFKEVAIGSHVTAIKRLLVVIITSNKRLLAVTVTANKRL